MTAPDVPAANLRGQIVALLDRVGDLPGSEDCAHSEAEHPWLGCDECMADALLPVIHAYGDQRARDALVTAADDSTHILAATVGDDRAEVIAGWLHARAERIGPVSAPHRLWSVKVEASDANVYGSCEMCGEARTGWTATRNGEHRSGMFCPTCGHEDQPPSIDEP